MKKSREESRKKSINKSQEEFPKVPESLIKSREELLMEII